METTKVSVSNSKVSPLNVMLILLIIVSIIAGVYQVAIARNSATTVPSANNGTSLTSSASVGGDEAIAQNSTGLVAFVMSTSPKSRVIVGTLSVIAGLALFGLIRRQKGNEPKEGE